MKNALEFYTRVEELDYKGDYKELLKISIKCSKSNNQELAAAAIGKLSIFDSYGYVCLDKQIEYSSRAIKLEEKYLKASAIENLAICYRCKGDLQAYKYFLEKAMELGNSSAALNLAILYSISDKEKTRVKKLLKIVLADANSFEIDREEAEQLLEDMDNNRNSYEYLLAKTPIDSRKLPLKEAVIMTDDLEELLLEAITNYELGEYKKSFKQFRKLANTYRIPCAMLYLGDCYFYGKGIKPSYDKAAVWYHEAEKSTISVEAMLKLANLYKDIRQMLLYKYYLEKAKAHGSDKATLLLAKLYAITPKEKEMVKSLLEEILTSKTATMDVIYEAEILYKAIK